MVSELWRGVTYWRMSSNFLNCINSAACICTSTILIIDFMFHTTLLHTAHIPWPFAFSPLLGVLCLFGELHVQYRPWRTTTDTAFFSCRTINDIQTWSRHMRGNSCLLLLEALGAESAADSATDLRFMYPVLWLELCPMQLPSGSPKQWFWVN